MHERGEDEDDRARREAPQVAPYHRTDVQPLRRVIEPERAPLVAVVDFHLHAAGHRDHDLLQLAVAMGYDAAKKVKNVVEIDRRTNAKVVLAAGGAAALLGGLAAVFLGLQLSGAT